MSSFESFFERLKAATNINSQFDLAKALGINRSAITQAKSRQVVPQSWILPLCRRYALNPDWLQLGKGHPKMAMDYSDHHNQYMDGRVSHGHVSLAPHVFNPNLKPYDKKKPDAKTTALPFGHTNGVVAHNEQHQMHTVPKIGAKLLQRAGLWEVETLPVEDHTFPMHWLSRMGNPKAMVVMDVIGDSMEKTLHDGDTIMIDQSRQTPGKGIWAVSHKDSISIKRIEKLKDGGLLLKCDNQDYEEQSISPAELKNFKIIGKVVWMCRDCRWY